MLKLAIALYCVGYLWVGLMFEDALHQSMPAVSLAGRAYVTAEWPFFLKANPIHAPIFDWCFNFDG